jgi:hypothetical protein
VWTAVYEELVKRAERRDPFPAPPTITHLYWTGVGLFVCATGAVLLSLEVVTGTNSWFAWAVVTAVMAGAGSLGTRFGALRRFATAWLVGTAAADLFVASILIFHGMR